MLSWKENNLLLKLTEDRGRLPKKLEDYIGEEVYTLLVPSTANSRRYVRMQDTKSHFGRRFFISVKDAKESLKWYIDHPFYLRNLDYKTGELDTSRPIIIAKETYQKDGMAAVTSLKGKTIVEEIEQPDPEVFWASFNTQFPIVDSIVVDEYNCDVRKDGQYYFVTPSEKTLRSLSIDPFDFKGQTISGSTADDIEKEKQKVIDHPDYVLDPLKRIKRHRGYGSVTPS